MTAVTPAAPPPTRKPPTYLIDPGFQLKYTALMLAIVVVLMAVLGSVIWRNARLSAGSAHATVKEAEAALHEAHASSKIIRMNRMLEAEPGAEKDEVVEALDADDKRHDENLRQVRERSIQIQAQHRQTMQVLAAAGLAFIVLLGMAGIYITRKIVGPVFKMKRLLRKVGTGRLVVREKLEKGDELGDLFHTFVQMTYSLRALQSDWVATLDAAIRQAEAAGETELVGQLRQLREQLSRGLGGVTLGEHEEKAA